MTSGVKRKKRNSRTFNSAPVIRSRYLGEPRLVFADGREDVDPKLGISRFGPESWLPSGAIRLPSVSVSSGLPTPSSRRNVGLRHPLPEFTETKTTLSFPVAWLIAAS